MDRREMLSRLSRGEDPLEVSIKKWEDIAQGKNMDIFGAYNCAFCQKYLLAVEVPHACLGCPIYNKTGLTSCENTPFEDYNKAYTVNNDNIKLLKKIARREVEFLKSLRKK